MTGANLARAMRLSAPTVHEMLGRLERDGYIARNAGRAIEFTDAGREHAESIVSRHRMIERFLTDVVGVPWDDVHEEAEKLEHAMTPRFEAYVRASVGDAETCPHGHPIRVGRAIDGVPLADCEVGAKVTILRLENEAEDLLHYLKEAGIEPGIEGEVASTTASTCRCAPTAANRDRHRERRRDRVGGRRSLAAAADRAARAAGAGPRALRPLTAARQRALALKAAADLVVDRRMVQQVEVRGAADVAVVIDRERSRLPRPVRPRARLQHQQVADDPAEGASDRAAAWRRRSSGSRWRGTGSRARCCAGRRRGPGRASPRRPGSRSAGP